MPTKCPEFIGTARCSNRIIEIYGHLNSPTQHLLLMEIARGGELFERIMGQRNFIESQALYWVRQLLSAVTYLHAEGLAHRDLKVTRPRQNVPRIILADTLTRPRARARARVARRDTSSPRTCCSARRPTSARRSRSPTLGSRARRSRATSTAASRRA